MTDGRTDGERWADVEREVVRMRGWLDAVARREALPSEVVDEGRAQLARVSDEWTGLTTALRAQLAERTEAHRQQYQVLAGIRLVVDAVLGPDSGRRPGAAGAVGALIERYAALQARVAALDAALGVEVDRFAPPVG